MVGKRNDFQKITSRTNIYNNTVTIGNNRLYNIIIFAFDTLTAKTCPCHKEHTITLSTEPSLVNSGKQLDKK